MKKSENFLTVEGKRKLEKELKRLIEVERPKVIQEIKEARAQGDLSENAEFDAAREKQGKIENQIRVIEGILENAKLLSADESKTIILGSTVKILNLTNKKESKLKIVGPFEADPFSNKVSYLSPIAEAIIGHSIGDIVKVHSAKKYNVKILDIKR